MKKLLIAISLIALTGAGCAYSVPSTPTSSPETSQAGMAFDVPATFSIGESITFRDGITIKLTAINDSRCKPDVQCFWAGELSPVFLFTDADGASQEFTLGTTRIAQVTIKNYVITLDSATTDQATITVSKK